MGGAYSVAEDFLNGKTSNRSILVVLSMAVAGWILAKMLKLLRISKPRFPAAPVKGNAEDGIVKVYGFPQMQNTAISPSAWVTRICLYCKICGIPYQLKQGSPDKSPRGKVPFIKHGNNVVPDSELILRYLKATYPDKALPDPTDPFLKAVAAAAEQTAASLAQVQGRCVWMDDEGFAQIKGYFDAVPLVMRPFIEGMVRGNAIRGLKGSGIAAFTDEEFDYQTRQKFAALSGIIGDSNRYLVGDQPCTADCLVFAFLDCFFNMRGMRATKIVNEFPNLKRYVDNMRNTYCSDDA